MDTQGCWRLERHSNCPQRKFLSSPSQIAPSSVRWRPWLTRDNSSQLWPGQSAVNERFSLIARWCKDEGLTPGLHSSRRYASCSARTEAGRGATANPIPASDWTASNGPMLGSINSDNYVRIYPDRKEATTNVNGSLSRGAGEVHWVRSSPCCSGAAKPKQALA